MIDYKQYCEKSEHYIKDGGYKRVVRFAENILLRRNDHELFMGKDKFDNLIKAFENVLEDYKDDEIYNYYYNLNNYEHGFCNFERWKLGLLF